MPTYFFTSTSSSNADFHSNSGRMANINCSDVDRKVKNLLKAKNNKKLTNSKKFTKKLANKVFKTSFFITKTRLIFTTLR